MAQIHYLYEIKNKLNGKIYIGIHSTENIDDGYMGSGSLIMKAIEKYGKHNFTKTILEYCDNRELLVELEKKIVNDGISWKWIQKEEIEKYLDSGWKLGKIKSGKRI
jgi:hypothetical protein